MNVKNFSQNISKMAIHSKKQLKRSKFRESVRPLGVATDDEELCPLGLKSTLFADQLLCVAVRFFC